MPKGAAAAPVRKLTAAILIGSFGIALLAWPIALPPPRAPTDTAVAPIYFKNFLRERSFDILPTSFLSDGLCHQSKVRIIFISPPFDRGHFPF
jgi:hypothetical protein